MNQQIFDARSCNGACETEMGCNCWSGVQRVKVSEADLDARRAEIEAATIERRARYMAIGNETRKLETRDLPVHEMQHLPYSLSEDAIREMMAQGTLSRHVPTEPTTVTWRQRLLRWWRHHIVG